MNHIGVCTGISARGVGSGKGIESALEAALLQLQAAIETLGPYRLSEERYFLSLAHLALREKLYMTRYEYY